MLTNAIVKSFKTILSDIERLFFPRNNFPYQPALNYIESSCPTSTSESGKQFSIHDFMQDTILWAVPKHRVTVERKTKKKYGSVDTFKKTHTAKTDIMICVYCGHDYHKGHLCQNCYTKVKAETEEMQEAIKKELGLQPVEQEIVVLYQGEKESEPSEFWQGKRIVELPKPRPQWFSRNLLEKSTVTTSEQTDVKPESLG